MYVGVDGGLKGAVCLLNEKEEVIKKWIMPVIKADKLQFDINEINKIFDEILLIDKEVLVGLEKAHTRPVQGIRAAFSTGYCFGLFEGILVSKKISYEVINPSIWMKNIFVGLKNDDKKMSLMYCNRKWPNENWKPTERSKNDSDGLTDACCIALYLLLKNRGSKE